MGLSESKEDSIDVEIENAPGCQKLLHVGVLPYAFNNGQKEYLLARGHSWLWSDFGGSYKRSDGGDFVSAADPVVKDQL